MSASREKKKRFEERGDGTEKRQVRAKSDYENKKHKKLISTIATTVIVVLLVFAVVMNSNLFYTGVAAVKTGDTKYTAADFNYEYYNTYYNTYENIANTYGSYASLLLDPSKPLDEQNYSDSQTWADYFEDQAFTQLQQMAILNDMAKAEGWTLSAEQQREIDSNIDQLKTAAASNGYSDYRAYLRALYGKGITEDRLRSLLESSYNATYYSQYLADTWMNGYTEEELDEYYDSIRNDYDLVSYMYYYVDGSAPEDGSVDADTAMANARDIANEIAAAGDQTTFAEAVYRFAPEDSRETYADPDACLNRLVSPSRISDEEWKAWLMSSERQSGDSQIFGRDAGYYVLLFLDRSANDFNTANFRGITIQVQTDADSGEITDQTRSEAQATVDIILEAFNADPTEENFAELADTYDVTGAMNGGLYSDTIPGSMSAREVEDWVFDEATQPGEVKSFYDDGFYYVVYALERGDRYDRMLAKNMKANDQYSSMVEAAKADYVVETKFAYRFTK